MEVKRIEELKSLSNTRDLGGFITRDGKIIKPRRLIRSGELKKASSEDIKILTETYHVHTVLDLRIDAEREQSPDPEMNGVKTVVLPVLDSSFFGIARDENSMEAWLKLFDNTEVDPIEVFKEMYRKLMFSDYVKPYYRVFFNTLLQNKSGAVLWHCSAGKDRAGIATVLTLMSLGVNREDIIKDYLMTGKFQKKELRKLRLLMPIFVRKKRVRECIKILLGVEEIYLHQLFEIIDRDYGNDENYLREFIGLTQEELDQLKEMYLTEEKIL
ncbi:MAG: tyrosine-protein phosphatase [Oscillospiraceae bacterium]|nr:tyrosine-protein phosphatase [Oscillospiraceae bacterium]